MPAADQNTERDILRMVDFLLPNELIDLRKSNKKLVDYFSDY